jgi:uncharacterized protein GlcG (DUF336 family)
MTRVPARLKAAAISVSVLMSAAATLAHGQGLVTTQKLSAALANELVGESVAACVQKGYKVVAVVVDLDGVRQALLRGDGAPIHSMDNAYYKAYSAASLTLGRKEGSTREVAARMAKNAPSAVPNTPLPNVTYGVGGVAIRAGGNIIGGLGVSGAPGGQFDEECANAALAKIADRMK